jgi:uncharacterized protein involved in copper resistance
MAAFIRALTLVTLLSTAATAGAQTTPVPLEFGARVRYEIKRELAPYAGLVWHRKLFGTGDLARAHGEETGGWRLVSGFRVWF